MLCFVDSYLYIKGKLCDQNFFFTAHRLTGLIPGPSAYPDKQDISPVPRAFRLNLRHEIPYSCLIEAFQLAGNFNHSWLTQFRGHSPAKTHFAVSAAL